MILFCNNISSTVCALKSMRMSTIYGGLKMEVIVILCHYKLHAYVVFICRYALYLLRFLVALLVVLMYIGSGVAIYFTVDWTTDCPSVENRNDNDGII